MTPYMTVTTGKETKSICHLCLFLLSSKSLLPEKAKKYPTILGKRLSILPVSSLT